MMGLWKFDFGKLIWNSLRLLYILILI